MAAAKLAFRRVQVGDFASDQIQRQAQQATQALRQIPFSSGVWLRNVAIGTGDTVVNHGLGRKPQGYIVTRVQGNAASIVESLPANQPPDQTRQYAFVATAATTVDLWVF